MASMLGGIYYYYYSYNVYGGRKTQQSITTPSFFSIILSSGLRDTNTYNYIVVFAPSRLAAGIRSIIGQHMNIAMNIQGTLNATGIVQKVSRYTSNGWSAISIGGDGILENISFDNVVIKPYFSAFRPYMYIIYYMHNNPAKIALILTRDNTANKTLQIARELKMLKGPIIIFVGDTIISINYQVTTIKQQYTTYTGTFSPGNNPSTTKRLTIIAYVIGNTTSSGEHKFTIKLRNITLYYYKPSNILNVEEKKSIRLNNTVAVFLGEKLVIIDHSDCFEDKASWTIRYGSRYLATFIVYADKPSGEPVAIISLDGKELVRIYFDI
ncbi:MAG: hypothetical protein GXO43_04970 [Crenarchaeota archaeon]|nr:hypothetical protein [Thermoproteota archaeon]